MHYYLVDTFSGQSCWVGRPLGDRIRSGGEERSRFLAERSLRNIHQLVVGQPVQIMTQAFATKPFGQVAQ